MEFNEEPLTYVSAVIDPFVLVNEIDKQKHTDHKWLNKVQHLADEGHPKIDICKRLLKCFHILFPDLRLVQILESAGYAEVAAYMVSSNSKLQQVPKSCSTSRKNVIYFKDIKQCLVYNKSFECPLDCAERIHQKIITQIKRETDERKLHFLHDKLFLSLAVHSDIPLGRDELEPSDLSFENLFRQEAYDKMLDVLPKTSNLSLMRMVMFGRLANAFVYKNRKDYEMAEKIINAGRQLALEVENCPLKIDFYYLDVHYILRKFERDPSESLQTQLIATARRGLELFEDEEESIRCQWTLMIMMRMIFCLVGIGNDCRIIMGCAVPRKHLTYAKCLLVIVDSMEQYMEQKRKLLYYMARARISELEENLDLALSYLATAIDFASNIHKVDHSFIIKYQEELQQRKNATDVFYSVRIRKCYPNLQLIANRITFGSVQFVNESSSSRPPPSGQSYADDANVVPHMVVSQFSNLHGESEQCIADKNAGDTIHLESMENSLGPRLLPIGQSFEAFVNPNPIPYHTSNTQPISSTSEEGTSDKQLTYASITTHVCTASTERLPSSDPAEGLNISLSDFKSQSGVQDLNYEIGTEIIQYEGIKDEYKNEDRTISANRFSKADAADGTNVGHRTNDKKATSQTRVLLLGNGFGISVIEAEETGSSFHSEILFGDGGERKEESRITVGSVQCLNESLISRPPPSRISNADDANVLPHMVVLQFSNLHGESEQYIADRNAGDTIHLESMENSLGPRLLPIGQSFEAFVNPNPIPYHTSNTQPISSTSEEGTSDKQLTYASITTHVCTASTERLPSSDPAEILNLSLSDFKSQSGVQDLNYKIGTEIIQYEGIKDEYKNEDSTISANRFSKADAADGTNVGHRTNDKKATSQTRVSLLDNGFRVSVIEVEETGSSFHSEILFGDGGERKEESRITVGSVQCLNESLSSRPPPSGLSYADDANVLPHMVVSQFSNLHGESEQYVADRNAGETIYFESMENSLGPRHLPIGQSFEAFVNPNPIPHHTSNTQSISSTSEEGTSDKQLTYALITSHICTASMERFPSSDPAVGLNLSLSDFKSQSGVQDLNFEIGTEIIQYEGIESEYKNEDSTISANRFSKADEADDINVGHRTNGKKATSQTRGSLTDHGVRVSVIEAEETGSSFHSEILFGDGGERKEESTRDSVSSVGKLFGDGGEHQEGNTKHSMFDNKKLHGDYGEQNEEEEENTKDSIYYSKKLFGDGKDKEEGNCEKSIAHRSS